MNKYSLLKLSALLVLVVLSANIFAAIDVYEFDDEAKRSDFVELTKELRCPKCQNQDIADSNAPIAKDMRAEVHRLLEEGKDKESIVDYMIERFGEFVSYKPKKSSETYILWYGPWALILLGAVFIFSLSRFNKKDNKKDTQQSKVQPEDLSHLLAKYDDKK